MSWGEAVLWWVPTVAVVAMTTLGLVALLWQGWRRRKKNWIAGFIACGLLAIGASAWRQIDGRAALDRETEQLGEVTAHLGEVGRLLGVPLGATQNQTFDAFAAAIRELNAKLNDLETKAAVLQEKFRSRTIDPEVAAKIAEYLRHFGSHRVVMSCVPDDVEAYTYANRIANVLRAAGWEALGPETTTIFGATPAIGITLYVRAGDAAPEGARLLIDGFSRFNIPYQSGVAASDAIPDPATVELFVGPKP
jgi:hypothetical protein